jgi:hypothetical protein
MTEPRSDDRAEARKEAARLLGLDVERLSPADALRVDLVSSLRLVVDSEQASILSGGAADVARLNVAVASLIALLPNSKLPEPKPADGGPSDPRVHMWNSYLAARRRGEIAKAESTYEGALREVERLRAEVEALKAGAAAPTVPNGTGVVPKGPVEPALDNVVPLARPTTAHQCAVAPQPPKPAPQPQAANMVDLRAGYNNAEEPWRGFVGGRPYDRWSDNR